MHEQSETTQDDNGQWVNVYGQKTPEAGQTLPQRYPYESPSYPTSGDASKAASRRSRDEGRQQYDPAGPFPGQPNEPRATDPQSALISLMNQRSADPQNLGLRDQEHAAFSQHVINTLGPILGPAVVAASVPAYSAAKAVAQPLGMMKGATPPSFGEVKAGLSPLWGGNVAPAAPQQQMPQPNPQPVDPTFANKLYTLMRMWGLLQSPDRQATLGTR